MQMDTQRLILFFVFSFSILLLWEAWQKEARGPQQPPAAQQQQVPTPSAPLKSVPPPTASAPTAPKPATAPARPAQRARIKVTTDLIRAEIDTEGGDIAYLELLRHKDTRDNDKHVVLFGPEHRYSAQSGL